MEQRGRSPNFSVLATYLSERVHAPIYVSKQELEIGPHGFQVEISGFWSLVQDVHFLIQGLESTPQNAQMSGLSVLPYGEI